MFTGDGPEVGVFTQKDGTIHLEILPAAHELKDTLCLSIMKSMQLKITTHEMLKELIETSSPYSSLQFVRL